MSDPKHPAGCLLRIFWMAFGNLLLFLLASRIFFSNSPSLVLDAGLCLVALLIVAARYLDIRFFGGTDEFGTPSTLRDWRRHAVKVLSLAAFLWLTVRLIVVVRG